MSGRPGVFLEAQAITFLTTQFDVTAIATADGAAPGSTHRSSPPSPTPVSASAASVGAMNIATAGAIGGPGLLTASADASSAGGIANAVGTAHFAGTFVMSAAEPLLYVDFRSRSPSFPGSGLGSTSLFVSLSTRRDDALRRLRHRPMGIHLFPGTTYLLDLTLTSEASAGFPEPGVRQREQLRADHFHECRAPSRAVASPPGRPRPADRRQTARGSSGLRACPPPGAMPCQPRRR